MDSHGVMAAKFIQMSVVDTPVLRRNTDLGAACFAMIKRICHPSVYLIPFTVVLFISGKNIV